MYELIKKSKVAPAKHNTPIQKLRTLILADHSLYSATLLIYPSLRLVIAIGCAWIVWIVFQSPFVLNIAIPLVGIHVASEAFIYLEKNSTLRLTVKLVEEDADAEAKAANSD